jgi:hypothetical protein
MMQVSRRAGGGGRGRKGELPLLYEDHIQFNVVNDFQKGYYKIVQYTGQEFIGVLYGTQSQIERYIRTHQIKGILITEDNQCVIKVYKIEVIDLDHQETLETQSSPKTPKTPAKKKRKYTDNKENMR